MTIDEANLIVTLLGIYFLIGFVFAAIFVTLGVQRIDPAARSMPVRVRLLILPGTAFLWPLMSYKWLFQKEPPVQ